MVPDFATSLFAIVVVALAQHLIALAAIAKRALATEPHDCHILCLLRHGFANGRPPPIAMQAVD